MKKNTIVVVGFGWASLGFLQHIDTNKYEIILISKENHFVYTPLLAQNINNKYALTIPVSHVNKPITFFHENVETINFLNKEVISKKNISYQYLVFSHGSEVNTFGIPGVDKNSYFLKSYQDSIDIRNKLKNLPINSKIAVIGCGLAGTEIIGTLSDMKKFKIIAIDALKCPITTFDKKLSEKVVKTWNKENINMMFNSFVKQINEKSIEIKDKPPVLFDMAIWCGGIKMSLFSKKVNELLHLNNQRGIPVNKYLNIEGHENLFAIGDCAFSGHPPTAQVAYQQGIYLAKRFNGQLHKKKEFNVQDKGQICYIGNGQSVYQNNYYKGGGRLMGYFNNFVHLYNFGKIYVKKWV